MVTASGPGMSSVRPDGASGFRAATTAALTSPRGIGRKVWSPPTTGMTSGKAASALIRPVPPNAARSTTSDGRRISQSRPLASTSRSVSALVRA